MRLANRIKDYTQIDALIREHIPRFLYNNGEGKLVIPYKKKIFDLVYIHFCFSTQVTISEIVKRRNNTYDKLKSIVSARPFDGEQING